MSLTPTGFETKSLAVLKSEIESALTTAFGDIDLRAESVFGQLVGLEAQRLSLIWDLANDIYLSQYPDSASGLSLDFVCALTGVLRQEATPTQVTAQAYGTVGTVLPAGTLASYPLTSDVYEVIAITTITDTDATFFRVALTSVGENTYTITIGGTPYSYLGLPGDDAAAIIAGLFAALPSDPPFKSIVDEELLIDFQGIVTSVTINSFLTFTEVATPVNFKASIPGVKILPALALNQIDTPISGWNSILNLNAGAVGTDIETDTELRLRREQSLSITATNTVDALLSKLRQVDLVLDVVVRENNTETTDAFGTPRQHVWVIIEGGDNTEIATIIYNTIAAGIGMRGAIEVLIESPLSGNTTSIFFDRPTIIEPLVVLDYIRLSDFPVDGETQIQNNLVSYGDAFKIDEDLIFSRFYIPINQVDGVEISSLTVNAGTANIVTAPDEKIRIPIGNITLNDVTP